MKMSRFTEEQINAAIRSQVSGEKNEDPEVLFLLKYAFSVYQVL